MKTSFILQAMTAPSSSLTGIMKCGILKSNMIKEYYEATNQLWMKTDLIIGFCFRAEEI